MDLKLVVKEMLKKGTPPEKIKENLVELGVQNPDEIINAVLKEEAPAPKPAPQIQQPVPKPEEKQDVIQEPKNLFELVDSIKKPEPQVEEKPADLFSKDESEVQEEQEDEDFFKKKAPDKKESGLMVTRVSDEDEKDVSLGDLIQEKNDLMQKMPTISSDDVEKKLDETIALLKALKELNKDILDTERKVLLRLKD